jgi:hypothetical protein
LLQKLSGSTNRNTLPPTRVAPKRKRKDANEP